MAGMGRGRRRTFGACCIAVIALAGGLVGARTAYASGPPGIPLLLTVSANDIDASLVVTFAPSADDGGAPIISYAVSCTSSDGGDTAAVNGFGDPLAGFLESGLRTLAVAGATEGKTYTCTVSASNANGDSAPSNESDPVVAGRPVHAVSAMHVGATSVSFVVVPAATDLGYEAQCTSSNGGVARTAGSASTALAVSGLTAGKRYSCGVRAFIPNGTSSPFTTPDFVVGRPSIDVSEPGLILLPVDVGGDAATVGNGSIVVGIAPGLFHSYLPITSYRGTCASSNGGATGTATVAASSKSITVAGLTNGKIYACSLAASNSNGFGLADGVASGLVPGRPVPPFVGDIEPRHGALALSFFPGDSPGGPTTRWNATCNSSDGGTSGSSFVTSPLSPIVVSGLTNGKTYLCAVNATNAQGAGPTCDAFTFNAECFGDVLGTPLIVGRPGPPNEVDVTPTSSGTVSVSVLPPDHNGGSVLTGYDIQCTSPDGGVGGVATNTGAPAVVSGLTDGKSYICQARGVNSGGPGVWTPSMSIVIVGRPSAPVIDDPFGAVTPGDGQLSIAFAPPDTDGGSAITGYSARCTSLDDALGGGGSPVTADSVSSPIVVGGLTNGVTYLCSIVADTADGSGAEAFVPGIAGPPQPPTINSVTPGNGRIAVRFTPPFTDLFLGVFSYKATCSSSNGGAKGTTTVMFGSTATVSGLTNSRSYTCTVRAVLTSGLGPLSTPSNVVKPGLPTAPRSITASAGVTSVTVSFASPSSNGGFSIVAYGIVCTSTNGGVSRTQLALGSPATVTGLTKAKTYTCRVGAINSQGEGLQSSTAAIAPGLPTAPRSLVPLSGNARLTLEFASPAANGGSAVTGYRATCTSSNGGATNTRTATASPITVTGLTNLKSYKCSVVALNSNGAGVGATTQVVVPGVPTAATNVAMAGGNESITLTFGASASDGGSAITSYDVICTSANGGAPGLQSGIGSPLTVSGLTDLKKYTCTITPTNSRGPGISTTKNNIFVYDPS